MNMEEYLEELKGQIRNKYAKEFVSDEMRCHIEDSLGCIVGCSCGVTIGLQCLSNVLIVSGVLPLTDSVLPFFASGLSFALVDYILLGLVMSIYRYKDIRRERPAVTASLRRVE